MRPASPVVITRRSRGGGAALVIGLVAALLALASPASAAPATQVGGDIPGLAAGDTSGAAVALSADGQRVIVGSPMAGPAGEARVYGLTPAGWAQIGATLVGEGAGDEFGFAVDISDDGATIVVGGRYNEPGSGNNVGHARVFRDDGGTWTQVGVDLNGSSTGAQAGYSVGISGDGSTVVMGEPFYKDGGGVERGRVRVRTFQPDTATPDPYDGGWPVIGQLDGANEKDRFGEAVAISGDATTIIIGAQDSDAAFNNAGQAQVFRLSGGNWVQVGDTLLGFTAGDLFGSAVDINADGNAIIVGAKLGNVDNGPQDAGSARVFRATGDGWQQIGSWIRSDTAGDNLGESVAISGDGETIAIGVPGRDDGGVDAGQARILRLSGGDWVPVVDGIDGAAGSRAGSAVNISRDASHVAVGFPSDDVAGADAGVTRVYGPIPPGPLSPPTASAGGPYTTPVSTPVSLTATGSDPDGGTVIFAWDLDGDGTFESPGQSVQFPASPAGTYDVAVRVTDDEGQRAEDATTVTVGGAGTSPPTASAGGPYSTPVSTPVTLTATGSDPDGGTVTFAWDLDGDGTFEVAGASQTFQRATAGSYTVTVRVTDDESQTATAAATVQVTPPPTTGNPPGGGGGGGGGTPPGGGGGGGGTNPPLGVAQTDGLDEDQPIPFAIAVSNLRFPSDGENARTPDFVVLARVDVFADALGGSVLTGDAPLLYSDSDALDPRTALEIDRLLDGSGIVYLLGGDVALSPAVEQALVDAGYTPVRLEGETRVETSVAIADAAMTIPGISVGQVGIARSDDWADAVTGGGWAALTGSPILVTQTGSLHPAVSRWLLEHPQFPVVILGGPRAISPATADQIGDASRVEGLNRYGTAVQIAEELWGSTSGGFLIANGSAADGWAFILAAGGYAAEQDQPFLLVDATRLPSETDTARCGTAVEDLVVLGSLRLVSEEVRDLLAVEC